MMPMNTSPHDKPIKPRILEVYHALLNRMPFSETDKNKYYNAKIGYEGEMMFYSFLQKNAPDSHLALYSLSLRHNNTTFQIDSLLINNNTLYLFEIKNYSGDIIIHNNNWYICSPKKEILNPLIQLKRSESLLRQFLASKQINIPIKSYIIFINPEFTLYQAPLNPQLIFHSQLKRFFHSQFFQMEPPSNQQFQLANLFVKNHIKNNLKDDLPIYTFSNLKKGVKCPLCDRFMKVNSSQSLKCISCSFIEKNNEALLRSIKEFHILFPDMAITTNNIYMWCRVLSKKPILRTLKMHLRQNGKARNTFYTII